MALKVGYKRQSVKIFTKNGVQSHGRTNQYTGFEFAAAFYRRISVEPIHYRSTKLNC